MVAQKPCPNIQFLSVLGAVKNTRVLIVSRTTTNNGNDDSSGKPICWETFTFWLTFVSQNSNLLIISLENISWVMEYNYNKLYLATAVFPMLNSSEMLFVVMLSSSFKEIQFISSRTSLSSCLSLRSYETLFTVF